MATAPLQFTFSKRKIDKGTITVGSDGPVRYTLETIESKLSGSRKTTTITEAGNELVGVIDWKEKAIGINGVVRALKDVEHHSSFSLTDSRTWRWGDNEYHLKFTNTNGTKLRVKLVSGPLAPPETRVALFNSFVDHTFHKDEPAVLMMLFPIQDAIEMMFVLLAVIYTDVKNKGMQKAVGEVAGAVADVAGSG